MKKYQIVNRIIEGGVVAVVTAERAEQAARIAEACADGGIVAIEISYTVPGATEIIQALLKRYENAGLIIGATTVLDPETARFAMLAGAQYIVTPTYDRETTRLCNRYSVPIMPGVMTVRECIEAMEAGADVLRLFPGEVYGPSMIKSFKAPLPQAAFIPTGGVDTDNIAQWIQAGAVAVGAGGSMTQSAAEGNFAAVEALARQFVEKVREARQIIF